MKLYVISGLGADFKVLEKIKFPLKKVIIGATFYTRSWINVPAANNGLYQPGKFFSFNDHKKYVDTLTVANGYKYYGDEKAQAATWYNEKKTIFVFDPVHSWNRDYYGSNTSAGNRGG